MKFFSFFLSILILIVTEVKTEEGNFHREDKEIIKTIFYAIPLNDSCIDRVEGEKVYLKEDCLLSSNNLLFLQTNSFGKLILKNGLRDSSGFFLPKIKNFRIIQDFGHCSIQLCEYNSEVEQHLTDAGKHALEAVAGIVGAAELAAGGNPIGGGLAAAAAGACLGDAINDLRQAYNSYNNDTDARVAGDAGKEKDFNERSETDSWDSASGLGQ
jgi:hypothetical protein